MAANLLLLDIMRSAPDWRTLQVEVAGEVDRIEALRDEDARDRAEARLERLVAAVQSKQDVVDAQAAPIQAFSEMAETALRKGDDEIETPKEIALQLMAYTDDLTGVILDEARRDPKPFIDAIVGDVAFRELMGRVGVGLAG